MCSNSNQSLSDVSIKLNSLNSVYHPSDVVSGVILIDVKKSFDTRGLILKVYGKNKCKFGIYRTVCFGKDVLLSHSMYLFGSAESPLTPIQEGMQAFSFTYRLPSYIPSSVSFNNPDSMGLIEYTIRLAWDVKNIEKCFICPFIVERIEDLNCYPSFRPPVMTILKSTSCCSATPAYLYVKIPCRAFAAGCDISMSAELVADSGFIKRLKCSLYQICDFNAFHGKDQIEHRLAKIHLKDGWRKRLFNGMIEVPKKIQTTNTHCSNIVQIHYELRFDARLSGCKSGMQCTIPIFIGSVCYS